MKHQHIRKLYRGFHGQITLECPTCRVWPHEPAAHKREIEDPSSQWFKKVMGKCDDPRCGPWTPFRWESRVLAIDWAGPVFDEPFCSSCGRTGQKETLTSESTGGLLTDDEIREIGRDRIDTLLFLITQMFDPDDMTPEKQLYPSLSADFVAKNTLQRELDVVAHFMELHALDWLDVAAAGNCHKFAFGTKWDAVWARRPKEMTT